MLPYNMLPRFFIDQNEILLNETLTINEKTRHYIVNVLRLKKNDEIILFNNSKKIFLAAIEEINTETLSVFIKKEIESQNESLASITLLQGIPKSDKLEWIVQKTTELGITKIIPIKSMHSIKKIPVEKIKRFSKIATEASKQAKRSLVPEIKAPQTVQEYFEKNSDKIETSLNLLFTQDKTHNLKDLIRQDSSSNIIFAIGPEGDFSTEEKELFVKHGFKKVNLGGRLLRSETAAITVTGILQYETGNLQF